MMHHYSRIKEAIEFAVESHKMQGRKAKDAYYFWHVFGVARLLDEAGASEEEVIAGLLHDLLEDTEVGEEEIEKRFGKEVLRIVKGVTVLHTSHPHRSWETRKKEMINKIKKADGKIKRVKLMDVLDNVLELLRDEKRFGKEVWDKFNAPKEKQKWYYYEMLNVFKSSRDLGDVEVYIQMLEEVLEELFK